jgi:transglycosylase-like protein with SLT domain
MRFVAAVAAAFLVFMFDVDSSLFSSPNDRGLTTYAVLESPTAQADPASASLPLSGGSEGEDSSPAAKAGSNEERLVTTAETSSPLGQEAFCRALAEAAEASELPVPFFARLIWRESRFNFQEVSRAGAKGVAQFMPETAAELGLDDPFDPFKALPASAKLLRQLRDEFGNLGLAAAAYNAGRGRIQKWLSKASVLPRETRDYVRIITGIKPESWTDEAQTVEMRLDLPAEAPCEGVGGLSKAKDVTLVAVALAPSVTSVLQKAEAQQLSEKIAAANRGTRRRFAQALKAKPHGRAERLAHNAEAIAKASHSRAHARKAGAVLAARAPASASHRHLLRVASAAR